MTHDTPTSPNTLSHMRTQNTHNKENTVHHKTVQSAFVSQTNHHFPKPNPSSARTNHQFSAHLWLYCLALQFIYTALNLRGWACASWQVELFWIISLKGPDANCLLPFTEKAIKVAWCRLNAPQLLHGWVRLVICISVMMSYEPRPPCVPTHILPFVATTSFFFFWLHLSLCLRPACAHDGERNPALLQPLYRLGKHSKQRLCCFKDVVEDKRSAVCIFPGRTFLRPSNYVMVNWRRCYQFRELIWRDAAGCQGLHCSPRLHLDLSARPSCQPARLLCVHAQGS